MLGGAWPFGVGCARVSLGPAGGAARTPRREPHPRLSAAEPEHIRGDAPEPAAAHIPWLRLLAQRQTWAVVVGKFMTDPVWWFYLYWLPKFLDAAYGIKLSQLALPLVVVYVVADAGSVTGGWLSGALMQRGWTVNRARKIGRASCRGR